MPPKIAEAGRRRASRGAPSVEGQEQRRRISCSAVGPVVLVPRLRPSSIALVLALALALAFGDRARARARWTSARTTDDSRGRGGPQLHGYECSPRSARKLPALTSSWLRTSPTRLVIPEPVTPI